MAETMIMAQRNTKAPAEGPVVMEGFDDGLRLVKPPPARRADPGMKNLSLFTTELWDWRPS